MATFNAVLPANSATGDPWPYWVSATTSNATTTATYWSYWNTPTTANTITITDPWPYWNIATTAGGTTQAIQIGQDAWPAWFNTSWAGTIWEDRRTPEQKVADEEAMRVRRAQAEERAARDRADREAAVQRAETLLHANITPHQRRMLRRHNRFYVRSQHGNRYLIERGHHQNVFKVDEGGKKLERLCVYATGGVPEGDCMLAQKFHLESNEDAFRRVAHITPLATV